MLRSSGKSAPSSLKCFNSKLVIADDQSAVSSVEGISFESSNLSSELSQKQIDSSKIDISLQEQQSKGDSSVNISNEMQSNISSVDSSEQSTSNLSFFRVRSYDPLKRILNPLINLRLSLSSKCENAFCCQSRTHLNGNFFLRRGGKDSKEFISLTNSKEKKEFHDSFCNSSLLVPSIYGSAGSGQRTYKRYSDRTDPKNQQDFSLPGFQSFESLASPVNRATCKPDAIGLPPLVDYLNAFANENNRNKHHISLKVPASIHEYATQPRLMTHQSPLAPRSHCFNSEEYQYKHLSSYEFSNQGNLLFSSSSKGSLDLGIHGSTLTSVFSKYHQNYSYGKTLLELQPCIDLSRSNQASECLSVSLPKNSILGIPDSKGSIVLRTLSGYARETDTVSNPLTRNQPFKVSSSKEISASSVSELSVSGLTPPLTTNLVKSCKLRPSQKSNNRVEKVSKTKPKSRRAAKFEVKKPKHPHYQGSFIVTFCFKRPEVRQLLRYVELSMEEKNVQFTEVSKEASPVNKIEATHVQGGGEAQARTTDTKIIKKRSAQKSKKALKSKPQSDFDSFQATTEELRDAIRKPNKSGLRQPWQDTPGCWTCRVRRKLCPQDNEYCRACFRLNLRCDRSILKPIYMSLKESLAKARRAIREITDIGRREALQKFNISKAKKCAESVSRKKKPDTSQYRPLPLLIDEYIGRKF